VAGTAIAKSILDMGPGIEARSWESSASGLGVGNKWMDVIASAACRAFGLFKSRKRNYRFYDQRLVSVGDMGWRKCRAGQLAIRNGYGLGGICRKHRLSFLSTGKDI
jgi:hypothetical protein